MTKNDVQIVEIVQTGGPANAIYVEKGKTIIDKDSCIGCGECLTVCKFHAIKSFGNKNSKWPSTKTCMEKMAEHALGGVLCFGGRTGYINFANHISKICDCYGKSAKENPPVAPDIGIFASTDPVAVDVGFLRAHSKYPWQRCI